MISTPDDAYVGEMIDPPTVSVLMPVHDAAPYLREALESVLAQSYRDFELVAIDDASSDGSTAILKEYHDPRVRVLRNEVKLGVAETLNRGLEVARGRFIARMDADDISLPDRFERQVAHLVAHPDVSVVGVKVVLIDADGNETGVWKEDVETTSCDEIRGLLPAKNCLAHPGVMLRREAALRYRYRGGLPYAQDYELWLRMSADGCRIEKLDAILLKYRVHSSSITTRSNAAEGRLKNVRIKWAFISGRAAARLRFTPFVRGVATALCRDAINFAAAEARAFLFAVARKTLIGTGKVLGALFPLRNRSGLFFFFPFFHVGGAERVHADIVATVADAKPWVFFTNRSANSAFKGLFTGKGKLLDISHPVSNIVSRHLTTGFLSSVINRHSPCVLFGANAPYFYDLLPHLGEHVRCVDLIHAFGGGLEEVSLPHVARLDCRVVINCRTVDDLRAQYRVNRLPLALIDRVTVVENRVEVPETAPRKDRRGELRILYVGRGSAEKRVHLVGKIAALSRSRGSRASFTLVGDLLEAVPVRDREYCSFTGVIADYRDLSAVYRDSDVILITSSREGFPMVVMEAMAHGVVPVCSDVGGIGVHVSDGVNGFLVPAGLGEEQMTERFVEILERLQDDRQMLARVSSNALRYSRELFSGGEYRSRYRSIFGLSDGTDEVRP